MPGEWVPTPAAHRPARFFYGWYIVAASCVMLFFNSGARYSIGVLFKPMLAEFGWSRSTLSLAVFLNMGVFALAVTVVGRLYDRYGPQWVILGATVLLSAGYILTACIQSFWQLMLCYGVLAALGLAGTSVPLVATLTSKWFHTRRGLAVSLALTGSCIGQFALVPLFTQVTLLYGWRSSYLAIGVIMLLVNVVLALRVIKGDPQQLGLQPLGQSASAHQQPSVRPAQVLPDLSLRQALRTRSYWCFLVVMAVCGSGDFFVTTHLIPWVTDQGVSRPQQAICWPGTAS
ncbi:MAG: MFS transporter [Candidatus Tectomicrobia bacterium]|uniref:MFS transporter n=1 Tax=Tectimicrobiota bacterium TaxID=2528274 RepID=A0A937W456_UNCTE|nr:MFS transporter [Candidatus Tectomicrobia bacterium]